MATMLDLENENEKLKRDVNFKELLIVIALAIGFWDKSWSILIFLAYLCFLLIDITRIVMVNEFWRYDQSLILQKILLNKCNHTNSDLI